MSQYYPTVTIIVLSYNSQELLADNLPSLLALDYPADKLEIMVADNASSDGTLAWVSDTYPTVRCWQNGRNLGFAAGNNAAVEAARSQWVAILNPDMKVEPSWLIEMVRPLQANRALRCVASRILSWDGNRIDFADAAMNYLGWGCQPGFGSSSLSGFAQDKPLLFACGGAMLIERELFLAVRGFDPAYFAYYEDMDLGWRLGIYGYEVRLAAQAVVYHRHHGSWGSVSNAQKTVLAEQNTLRSLLKNYAADSLALVAPAVLLLLAERSFLDIRPDMVALGLELPPAADGNAFGFAYYWQQVQQLVRQGDWRQLGQRVWDELGRRWRRRPTVVPAVVVEVTRPENGRFVIPPHALSRLLACRDILHDWDHIMGQRAEVQARRQKEDAVLFPLFQWSLISNFGRDVFGDDAFTLAMNWATDRFHLVALFEPQRELERPFTPPGGETIAASEQITKRLLRFLADTFTASQQDERPFRLGQPGPTPALSVPVDCVRRLGQLHALLWSLPSLPLPELLDWLDDSLNALASKG